MKNIWFFWGLVFLISCLPSTKNVEEMLLSSMNSVEEIIQNELNRLIQLSEQEETQQGDWDFIKAGLIKNSDFSALYWFALPDGEYYTSEKDKVDANLSDRAYFSDLLEGKKVIGYPIIGKTSGRKSFVIAIPVKKDGNIVSFLGTSVYLDEMWTSLRAKIDIPANYDFYAINTLGITMFDLETKDHLLDNVLEQDSPTLVQAVKEIIASQEGEVEYLWKGQMKKARYMTAALTGWRYVISYY
jgi:hypothetical protein